MDIGDLMSINRAIGRLQHIKKQIKTDIRIEFLIACCAWVQVRANEYLEQSDIGEAIKSEIKASWVINQTLNSAILTNTSEHAVYVEFGVGGVGERHPHPNSNTAGYEYDVPSEAKKKSKSGENFWVFSIEGEEFVDMKKGYKTKQNKQGDLWVITKGSTGVMYSYNALTDLVTYPQELKAIWKEVLVKNLG